MFNSWHMAKVISVAALAVVLTGGAASATTMRASAEHQTGNRHHGHDHGSPRGVFGTVAAVNGSTSSGNCGVATNPGVFTLNGEDNAAFTVDVSPPRRCSKSTGWPRDLCSTSAWGPRSEHWE